MPAPVHALVGGDLFLQLEALRAIAAELPPDVQRVNVDGETAEVSDVLTELHSFAMFSSAKLVVVRTADDFLTRGREALERYVAAPMAESVLVLRLASLPKNQKIYKLIEKHGRIHDCTAPRDVRPWIIQRAREAHRLTVAPEIATLLADLVGADLGRLDNELAKLALQCAGRADEATVRTSVAFQREREMWDMTDELAAGRAANALRRWRQLVQLDASAEYKAVTWLTIWLEKVRRLFVLRRRGLGDQTALRELKIWPKEKERAFLQNALALGEERAGQLIELLADLDRRAKSGLGEMTANVDRFILAAAPRSLAQV
jgi:DNA polymerase-3 subunit delta